MGTQSKRAFEHLPMEQKLSQQYYETIARGAFREVTAPINSAFIALADVKCSSVCFTNMSGKTIGVRRAASGPVIKIPTGAGKIFDVVDNAQELQVQNFTDAIVAVVQYECGGEVV